MSKWRKHCKHIDNLSLYIDDMLSDAKAREISEHIPTCAQCTSYYNAVKQAEQLNKRLPELNPPTRIKENVMKEVKKGKGEAKNKIKPSILYTAAAVVAGVALFFTIRGMYGAGNNDNSTAAIDPYTAEAQTSVETSADKQQDSSASTHDIETGDAQEQDDVVFLDEQESAEDDTADLKLSGEDDQAVSESAPPDSTANTTAAAPSDDPDTYSGSGDSGNASDSIATADAPDAATHDDDTVVQQRTPQTTEEPQTTPAANSTQSPVNAADTQVVTLYIESIDYEDSLRIFASANGKTYEEFIKEDCGGFDEQSVTFAVKKDRAPTAMEILRVIEVIVKEEVTGEQNPDADYNIYTVVSVESSYEYDQDDFEEYVEDEE